MSDIVADMVNQMGMSPQQLQQMSDQQQMAGNGNGQMLAMNPAMGNYQGMQPGTGMDVQSMSPEQQMAYMRQIQQQGQGMGMPQQQQMMLPPQDDSDDESSDDETVDDNEHIDSDFGMNNNGGFMDDLFSLAKMPLIVIVIFFVLSYPAVIGNIDKLLPTRVLTNTYYHVGARALLAGLLCFGAQFLLN